MELQGSALALIQQPAPPPPRRHHDLPHPAAILSLDQIQALRSSNEYTEGPSAVVRRAPGPSCPPGPPGGHGKQERTHEVIRVNNNNNYEHRVAAVLRAPGLSRSTSTGSAASSASAGSSASSEQGLLARSPPPPRPSTQQQQQPRPVRTQPKAKAPVLALGSGALDAPLKKPPVAGKKGPAEPPATLGPHQLICERCAKCKCGECTAPRSLPSCLACHGQCLCSADSALEHGTCMCLVKGAFYHCSSDGEGDEGDACADHPCSLSRSHCCGRFLCMGAMSLLFPCLLCYPPVKGCLKAGQSCHDRLTRPGCRCKNSNAVYCKLEPWAPGPHKPS